MYELLLRTETLFLGLAPLVLLAIGIPALAVGLVFWLGGSRYSTVIIGLLGATVGAVAGLLIGQGLHLHLWLCMLVGAAGLATLSALMRNVLVLVLAVFVIAAVSGAGYLAVFLDRMAPASPEPTTQIRTGSLVPVQSFSGMDQDDRRQYVDTLSGKEASFRDRLRAVLDNTWQAVQPHAWKIGISVIAGGLFAVFLVWLVKKALIALAYSLVGTATLWLGAQVGLLGVGYPAVSALDPRPTILLAAFSVMVVIGWAWQLLFFHAKPSKEKAEKEHGEKGA
jgi:hypothetical protein